MNTYSRLHPQGNNAPGYLSCSHRACSKKANPRISSHDCCGKPKHRVDHIYMERDGHRTD